MPGTDAAIITQARKLLAEDRPAAAKELLDAWIERNDFTGNRLLPQAYLLRGDATSADGDEYQALYDYEQVIKAYPGSPEFIIAVEREVEIANRYLHGLDRKWLGMRIANAEDVGVELMVRSQERMPGSRLGERASIELADYFYRERELSAASDAYELFEKNYPTSQYKPFAMERRIYANVARFKGPRYDTRPLTDARVLTRRFVNAYPARAAETGLNDALIVRIDDSAAESMWVAADWYFQRGDEPGGRYTLKRLVAKYPQSAAAERAVKLMVERGWLKQSELPSAPPTGVPSAEPVPEGTPPEAPRPIEPASPAGRSPTPATSTAPNVPLPGAPSPIEPATPATTPGKEPR
ncbi:MAG: outer membrane protein assembly factor BamD [Phycisphaerales bacterium]